MNRAAWWTCALLALSLSGLQARTYQRCELARELSALGVHPDHISTWVCIAYHESRFDTAANNPHSGDHGIFQISELYWCGAGKACGLPCAALRDDDIADDLECALQVHEEHTRLQGNGFLAWVVYPQHCKQSTKKYLIDCDETLKNASAPSEGRALNAYSPYSYDNRFRQRPAEKTYANNPNIDSTLLPSYLTISAIFRGSYGKVLDYNKINGVDWYNYKYDKVDELKVPEVAPGRPPVASTTTTSTTTTTTYAPPVKPWRYIETNQFRKTSSSDNSVTKLPTINNTASEKNAISFHSYETVTESTTRGSSFTPREADILPKVKSPTDSYKSATTFTSITKPANVTDTSYKSPALTASYKSRTTTYRPSPVTFRSSTSSKNNYVTSTTRYKSTDYTPSVKYTFPSFAFTLPTTTAKPKEYSSTALTFSPSAFSSRTPYVSTTTKKLPTTTQKPTTSWYTFTSRNNPLESSKTTLFPQNGQSLMMPRHQPTTRLFLTSSTPRSSVTTLYTTTTRKPSFYTTSTTQRPKFSTLSTTRRPIFYTSSTTQIPSFYNLSTTVRPTFYTSTTTLRPTFYTTSTTQRPGFTTLTTQRQTTQRTSRMTQNIFDVYLNPTKAPQLPSFFNWTDNKHKINIFTGGTTKSPAKSKEERSRALETR